MGEGHCSIPCINNQGVHHTVGDNPDPSATTQFFPLRPAFRCYTLGDDGSLTAWFGYSNPDAFNVYVGAGPENQVGGQVVEVNTAAGAGGVPTRFTPGLVEYAMSVR